MTINHRRNILIGLLLALLVIGLLGAARVTVAQDGPTAQDTVTAPEAATTPEAPDAPTAPDLDLPLPNIIVNTTALTADPGDGKCDLWEALQAVFQANYGMSPTYHECTAKVGGMNVIAFSVVGGTITVPAVGAYSDLPFVHGETVILGPITIAGSGASADTHLLRTAPGAKLTVVAVVLKNGHTSGAGPAIYSDNGATVNVIASFLVGNKGESGGGAIYSNGDLNLMGTSFINNTTGNTPGRGGAVYMTGYGSFKSQASTFTGNQAASGGAIYLEKSGGASSISESIFTANNVGGDAAGLGGGAVYNASSGGTLEINRTAFNANFSTQGAGGAIVNKVGATAYISNTMFDANIAGDSTHARNGGAIYNQGPLSIVKSTLVGNLATGGSGGGLATESSGQVTIGNATFFGNLSDSQGGAIYGTASSLIAIRNSTFSANIAGSTGDILYLGGTAQASIGNTILDGSTTPHPNCAGNVVASLGHNIDTGSTCAANLGLGDMPLTNPLLGALNFNGGSLPVLTTQMPSYASPAIDHGDPAICAHPSVDNEDETGAKRPKNGSGSGAAACDVGAVEVPERKPAYDAEPMPPGPINFGSVQVNTTITTSINVHNAGNYTLTLSNPAVGDATHFGLSTTYPVAVAVNAQKPIVLWCKPTATGQLATALTFDTTDPDRTSVSYSLLCNGTPAPAPSFSAAPVAPGPIEFGEVAIGDMLTQTITIKNNGTANLVVNQPGFTSDGGNFAHNFASPTNVAAGATSQFAVRCQPNKVGQLVGQLTFQTNDASQAQVSYNLNCVGVPPQTAFLVNTQNLKNPLLPADLSSPFGVAVSPDGLNAYVNGNATADGEIVVLKKQSSGLLAGSYLWTSQVINTSLGSPHDMKVSPDGQYLLATGGANNALAVYARDSGNGNLSPILTWTNIGGLNNPYGVAFSPDSLFAYVTNYTGNSISIFKHIGNGYFFTGSITATTMTTHTLQNPAGIVVSPDGKHVYVSVHTATASQGTLAVYRRDVATGALTPIQTRYEGDCQDATFICLFPVNGLASTYQLAISPDGYNLYVTSWYDHAVANFRRDPATGLVRWYGMINNSGLGGSGLTNAFGVAVSPDNKRVYVTSYTDDALVMFDREKTNGYLSFRNAYVRNAGSGAPALNGALQTAVSSDGKYVFAVGQADTAVAVFRSANPQPALFSLQPASVAQGGSGFTLIVKGTGFVNGAQVWWDGFHPTDTFINSSEMRATIPAAWISGAGNHTIKVRNPTPGGGDSYNTLTFQVTAAAATPVPSIDHLNPAGVIAGASGVQVDVYGSNFQSSGTTVTANGSGVVHTFIDSTHLRITAFNANTFAQPGTVNIQVNNTGGVKSNIVGLNVAEPGQNPVPSITALGPDWSWSLGAASPDLTLTITGTNFVDGAIVQWNGEDRPTKFISKTKLQATITGSDQLDPAYNSVMVKNPAPGGGGSNVLTFIVRPLHQLFIPMVVW